jgi:hypothetical protein
MRRLFFEQRHLGSPRGAVQEEPKRTRGKQRAEPPDETDRFKAWRSTARVTWSRLEVVGS